MSKPNDPIFYQDIVPTVTDKGRRKWLYVLQPKGWYYNVRTLVTVFYLLLFFTLPFIKINGNPLFQFDLINLKFVLFGKAFFTQDFILFGVAMLIALLSIIIFTLVFGRVFCGWICPQTIFMEMVFRRIEYWIEGPANKQELAERKEKDTAYYARKVFKHLVFLVVSFVIANTFLSYIIGVDSLFKIMREPVGSHLVGFSAIIGFTLVFYMVYAFVREIVCTVVCPYGRLQGVLLDKNSIGVAYDYLRGEPRGKAAEKKEGDCIDCGLCVKVCPTGIDIRNGTQLECVQCTACIDACNMMMTKVGKPVDLIKYASENLIADGKKLEFTYRIKMYTGVLVALTGLFFYLILNRPIIDTTVLRSGGQILQEHPDGSVSNLYNIKLLNKTAITQPYHLEIIGNKAIIEPVGKKLDSLKSGVNQEETFFIKKMKQDIIKDREEITIGIYTGDKLVDKKKVKFIGRQ